MSVLRFRGNFFHSSCFGAFVLGIALGAPTTEGGEPQAIESSVVKLYVYSSPSDPQSPWQKAATQVFGGSGVIIEGQRILTNAHVVEEYASLEVKRAGMAKRYTAQVVHFGHQCDLALLSVDDPSFFEGVRPLPIGELPRIQSEVGVYGFPIGGESVSVTAGIVSRIEVDTYIHSLEDLLLVQIDAPINSGNSGGPAITDSTVVGLAVQSLDDAENVGYIIPAPVISHFLEDVADGRYDGFPDFRLEWQDLESDAHRSSLGMQDEQTGVLATRMDYGSTGSDEIEPGDVLLTIDEAAVANNGTLSWAGPGRVDLSHLIISRQVGETISLGLLRDRKQIEKTVTLLHTPNLVPGRRRHANPSYLVFGGLVFRPLTYEYLGMFKSVPHDLANLALYQNIVTSERSQVILISRVLPSPVNRGYQDWEDFIVETVNGTIPRDMEHLAQLVDEAKGTWLRIVTEDRSYLTLNLKDSRAAHSTILDGYGIAHDRSQDLRDTISGAAARAAK